MCRLRCLLEVSLSHRELLWEGRVINEGQRCVALARLCGLADEQSLKGKCCEWLEIQMLCLCVRGCTNSFTSSWVSPLLLVLVLCLLFCWALLCLFLSCFLKLLALHVLQTVLWWDWLLLPEHLANSVKFSICQAYSSNYLLVTLIFSSCEENFTMFLFFAPVISSLLCTITCVKSFRCGLFCHVFGFHQNLSAFHVLKSSLEERK